MELLLLLLLIIIVEVDVVVADEFVDTKFELGIPMIDEFPLLF